MKKVMSLILMVAMVMALAACGGSSAPAASSSAAPAAQASAEKVTLICGHAAAPEQSIGIALAHFAENVKERTNGSVEITVYDNASIGEEEELIQSGVMGTVDIPVLGSAAASAVCPQFYVCDLPFAFATPEEAYKFYDETYGDEIFSYLEGTGVVGLAFGENGFRNLTNNKREIKSPADMKGLKMRVQSSQVYIDLMNALGADPTPIPFGELYTALQQGTVDGEENPIDNIYTAKLYEVQKYITIDRHCYDTNLIFFSEKSIAKLTDEQWKIVQEEAYKAAVESRDLHNASEDELKQKIIDYGCVITELSASEHQAFADATKDVYKGFTDIVGEDFMNGYLKAIGR